MKLLTKAFLCSLCFLLLSSLSYAAESKEEAYYTKVNIWYEEPAKIQSTNYHRGAIIPFGTKVNIVNQGGDKIKFTSVDQPGVTFVLFNMRKYSLMETNELFQQYFTQVNPKAKGGEFDKFSDKERDNIENGTLEPGMSKEATIASYGYPPKHKTPALTSNIWTYWDARSVRKLVTFKNNKLTKTEEVNEYQEGRPHWYHYVP